MTARSNGHAAAAAAPIVQTAEPHAELLERVVAETQAARQFSVAEIETMAKYVGSAGFGFTQAQAFALMMLCEADGLHPIHALRRYDIHKSGKYTMKAVTMLAEMQRLGWEVHLLTDPNNTQYQEFSFDHPTKPVVCAKMAFGVNEAEAAGLLDKDNYRGYAPDMFRARAISRACRLNEPGIVAGVYTPEEVSEFPESRPPLRQPSHLASEGIRADPYVIQPPAEPPAPAPQAEAESPIPQPRGECSTWIQSQIDDAENEWASICAKAKKPHKPLGGSRRMNVYQLVNGVINGWLYSEPPLIKAADVETDGKRDRTKVLEMVWHQWAADDDGEGLMDDIRAYLRSKIETAAAESGINLDSEPSEEMVHDTLVAP